jgi:3-oxoacyl-[acyl-carrier protein] reductase
MIDTNLTGALVVTRAFLPHMLSKKEGRIISISSIWGDVGGSCESHYSASKAGLIGFTRALSKEVGNCGITVNAVNPGCIMTDMMADYTDEDIEYLKEQTPTGVIGTPMDVANAVFFLAKKESSFITGIDLPVDGGFGR